MTKQRYHTTLKRGSYFLIDGTRVNVVSCGSNRVSLLVEADERVVISKPDNSGENMEGEKCLDS